MFNYVLKPSGLDVTKLPMLINELSDAMGVDAGSERERYWPPHRPRYARRCCSHIHLVRASLSKFCDALIGRGCPEPLPTFHNQLNRSFMQISTLPVRHRSSRFPAIPQACWGRNGNVLPRCKWRVRILCHSSGEMRRLMLRRPPLAGAETGAFCMRTQDRADDSRSSQRMGFGNGCYGILCCVFATDFQALSERQHHRGE
jgi:hypothetical protein